MSANLLRPLLGTDHHLRLQEVEMLHVFMHTGPDDRNGLCSWNNRRGRTYVGPVGRAPLDPPRRRMEARRCHNSATVGAPPRLPTELFVRLRITQARGRGDKQEVRIGR